MADQWGTTLHKLDLYVIKWNCGEIMYIYQGCQFCFDRCFVFSIGMECFSFEVFRGCIVHIYIYIYIYMCVCVCVFKIMWQWIYIYICVCVCFQNYVTVKDYLFRFFFFYYITAQIIYLNWATLASSDEISLKTSASYNNIRLWPFLPILKEWLLYNH
jgi:hypothetical protein